MGGMRFLPLKEPADVGLLASDLVLPWLKSAASATPQKGDTLMSDAVSLETSHHSCGGRSLSSQTTRHPCELLRCENIP